MLPAVHYTMGGILADGDTASPLQGLYSAGECSSVGIHGANRLGSNSLTELLVFGRKAGEAAAAHAGAVAPADASRVEALAQAAIARATTLVDRRADRGGERIATLRREMAQSMEDGCGIYRSEQALRATCDTLAALKQRYRHVQLDDHSTAWNTEWLLAIELGYLLDVAEAMAHSALARRESRGSHQRLDGFEQRDDVNFLAHSLAEYAGDDAPRIRHAPVTITHSPPGTRAYGAAGERADAQADAERQASEAAS